MSVPFEIPDWLIPTDDPPPDTSAVDPHRVEDLVNRFIAGKQDALFTGPDAHYRTTSGDAVRRLPYITNRLTDLKNEQLAEPLPYYPQSSAGLVPENLIQPLTDGDRAALGERNDIRRRLETLTPREREVLDLVVHGKANKVIAGDLKLSQRTVEIHRARVMEKMQASSLAHLVRMVLEVGQA